MANALPSLKASINNATNPAKQLRLTYTALHEAAHCVIACDLGEIVIEVKLNRRAETGGMKDSAGNFRPDNEAKILLAGVAFEWYVWKSYRDAYSWCENDFKQAFEILKVDESLNWCNPRIRDKGETPPIFKRELDIVERRLIALWPVVEYAAALILKNRDPVFPEHCIKWSNKVRRCINDRAYLLRQAPWVSQQLDQNCLEWLSQAGKEKERHSAKSSPPASPFARHLSRG